MDGLGDLAGFIENYFGRYLTVKGNTRLVSDFSSQELIFFAQEHLNKKELLSEEKVILNNLVGEEVCGIESVKNLLKDIHSVLK